MRMSLVLCVALSLVIPFTKLDAGDWPQYLGPDRNSICTETGLLKAWPKEGPKLLWDSKKVSGGPSVGTGISSLSIVQGKIFTLGDQTTSMTMEVKKGDKVEKKTVLDGDGFVYCLNAETGKELWKTKFGLYSNYGGYKGPRSVPTVDGERLYVITPHGVLMCLKTSDGSIHWQKDFKKDFGGNMMSGWGYSESPTIDGDALVCMPGGKKAGLVALNKVTGDVIWSCELPVSCGAGYASIVQTDAGGVKQYVTLMGPQLGLVGVNAKNGKFLWNYKAVGNGTANIPTPVIYGDFVFASTGYGVGSALVKLSSDGTEGGIKAEEVYFLKGKDLQIRFSGMLRIGDHVYGGAGDNQGNPFCLELKTGKFAWGPQRGGPGSGSAGVLFADGHLYFRHESGDVSLIEATPSAFTLKSSFKPGTAGNGWPTPVIYNGRMYLRGNDQILCYDIKQ